MKLLSQHYWVSKIFLDDVQFFLLISKQINVCIYIYTYRCLRHIHYKSIATKLKTEMKEQRQWLKKIHCRKRKSGLFFLLKKFGHLTWIDPFFKLVLLASISNANNNHQKICQIKCQKICQIDCQIQCQIYQIECQNICQI